MTVRSSTRQNDTKHADARGRHASTRAAARRVVSSVGLGLILASATMAEAGTQAQQTGQEEKPTFRASSQVVLLNVHVASTSGTPLPTLEAKDFLVTEDGVPQEVSFLRRPEDSASSAASVMLLVDTSSSLSADEMNELRRGVVQFIHEAPEGNELALAAFDDRFHPVSGFSRDRSALLESVERLTPGGGTALFDAIYQAVEALEATEQPRKALVLFTDGKDLDSSRSFAEVERRLEDGVTVVYAVGQFDDASRARFMTGKRYYKPPELEVNLNPVWALTRLSEMTGGHAMFPSKAAAVAPWLTRAARDWARVYVIGYRPRTSEGPPDGEEKLREIDVRLDPSRISPEDYVLRTRRSYRR